MDYAIKIKKCNHLSSGGLYYCVNIYSNLLVPAFFFMPERGRVT